MTTYYDELPPAITRTKPAGKQRLVNKTLATAMKRHPGKWREIKKNVVSSEATRLRRHAKEVGLELAFRATSVEDRVSATGKDYIITRGRIFVRYATA